MLVENSIVNNLKSFSKKSVNLKDSDSKNGFGNVLNQKKDRRKEEVMSDLSGHLTSDRNHERNSLLDKDSSLRDTRSKSPSKNQPKRRLAKRHSSSRRADESRFERTSSENEHEKASSIKESSKSHSEVNSDTTSQNGNHEISQLFKQQDGGMSFGDKLASMNLNLSSGQMGGSGSQDFSGHLQSEGMSIEASAEADASFNIEQNQFKEMLTKSIKADPKLEAVRKMNIDNLIQNVQTKIKDGGGEMKLSLNPEGLGNLNLKVELKDGQVQIEILADNLMTKNLMETGLDEVKMALESQNLKIEQLKVDISSDVQSEMERQSFEGKEQQFSREFMEQFSDERQAFRNQMLGEEFEVGPRGESPARGLEPLNIGKNGGAKRLNIFA